MIHFMYMAMIIGFTIILILFILSQIENAIEKKQFEKNLENYKINEEKIRKKETNKKTR